MDAESRKRLTDYIKTHSRTLPVDPETEALRDWLKCIEFLWESVGKKTDGTSEEDKRFDAYTKMFSSVPIGILEPAIIRAISNNGKYQVIPTPGAIWDEIRKVLELRPGEDAHEKISMWNEVRWDHCVKRFGGVKE